MAKNAKKSQVSPSSRASASATVPKRASDDQMALRTKSSEGMKRSARPSKVSVERRPKSAKKTKTKHKKKNDKSDTNKPKKPPTAFFYFLEDFRKDFQEQNPNVKSMRDIGKACGEKWKTMTYEAGRFGIDGKVRDLSRGLFCLIIAGALSVKVVPI
ncbi:hypothetical protein F2P56_009186 [Juglans regia]|uniref:HMG box domain-containing protein n=2 Tax=Juglans regia TaxID=51240 RepID=A0A833XW06_JUGRE|nr:high mobility group B protein 14-like isoform X2 [Juglans regia]KAF5472469.1 hypothetical protein F2P56_009186 [Juglans regia]